MLGVVAASILAIHFQMSKSIDEAAIEENSAVPDVKVALHETMEDDEISFANEPARSKRSLAPFDHGMMPSGDDERQRRRRWMWRQQRRQQRQQAAAAAATVGRADFRFNKNIW